MKKEFEKQIKKLIGDRFSTYMENRVTASYDATDSFHIPDYTARVNSESEIKSIINLCRTYRIPLIARGAGCGFSGGALAINGGLVLDVSAMDSIRIDSENLIAEVETGAITIDIDNAAKNYGLFYPPDPSSLKISTIGGNIAENAGGPRAVKYGVTGDYVMALRVVTADGKINTYGKPLKKDVAGYNMAPLFIGSEGTLGIITKAWLKLLPRPESSLSALIYFKSLVDAGKTISEVIATGLNPSRLEIMDALCINALKEAGKPIEGNPEAMLMVEVDGQKNLLHSDLGRIREVAEKHFAEKVIIATDASENQTIWELRHSLSPIINTFGNTKINEDVVVPRSEIPTLMSFVSELKEKHHITIVSFGHAGDGNIHVNFMFNKEDSETIKRVTTGLDELFKKVISLGGSISGEHGIGVAKLPYMHYQFSEEEFKLLRRFKNVFDPDNILNPGKIIPETE